MTSANRARSVLIDAALAVHGTPSAWDARASVHPCEGAKFHSPSPLITRKFVDTRVGPEVWLCPTCTVNLECFLYLAEAEPKMDWSHLREFGNTIRELGQRALTASTSDA